MNVKRTMLTVSMPGYIPLKEAYRLTIENWTSINEAKNRGGAALFAESIDSRGAMRKVC